MNRTRVSKWLAVSAIILLAVALSGCYEPQEGCLDVDAVNYDLGADRNDEQLCQFPELRLSIQHRYTKGDTLFRIGLTDSVYTDAAGNPFRITDVRFYVSNFRLIFEDGREAGVEEEVEFNILQPDGSPAPRIVEDNFLLASPRITSGYTLGTIRETGKITEVRFALGIEGLANVGDPGSFPDLHPLQLQDSSLYFSTDSGYVFQDISLLRDTITTDTIPVELRIGTEPYLKEVRLPAAFDKIRGFHLRISLQADYSFWFGNIDARQDSPASLIEKIVDNQAQSFSVVDIKLE